MFRFAIKKIFNNKALMLSLFAGILVAILISCTIPVYSAGISHRMLVTQLENYQNENKLSPGAVIISCSLAAFKQETGEGGVVDKFDSSANILNFNYCTDYLNTSLFPELYMPEIVKSTSLSTTTMFAGDKRDTNKSNLNEVVLCSNDKLTEGVEIIDGRLPSGTLNDKGFVEVIISKATQSNTKFSVGNVIEVGMLKEDILEEYTDTDLSFEIVGIFDYVSSAVNPIITNDSGNEIYVDYGLFYNELFVKKNLASKATWYFAGDYTKYNLDKIRNTINALDNLNSNLVVWGIAESAATVTPPIDQYQSYFDNVRAINVLLALFYTPILILVVFFIFMLSKFVVENDKNEIAMLNSRGAARKQIVLLYLLQGGLAVVAGILISPLLSLILCRFLGASSGFLEFAQRAPMKIVLSSSAYLFCFFAGVLTILTMLLPVYNAAKIEIVQHKRNRAKSTVLGTVLLGVLTFVCAGVSAYSYYVLVMQQGGLFTTGGNIQPLAYVFLISFFAFVALFFVLLYPLFLKLILLITKKKLSASIYSAFSRISRMEIREKFIVTFLTLTVAIGVFSSISARTLNGNIQSSIRYQYPCDIITSVKYYAPVGSQNQVLRPYLFDNVEGVESTKVTLGDEPSVNTRFGKRLNYNLTFMGITPDEFSSIVEWDDTILPQPLSYYLDLIKNQPEGCIISENTAKVLGNVNVGDTVLIRPDATKRGMAVINSPILAIVDAWPTYYADVEAVSGETENNFLVVVNNSAISRISDNLPHQVWMNTDKSITELKRLTIERGAQKGTSARLENVINGKREVYLGEINPVRQAVNGSLSLGFIAVMLICAIGFIIYWMISIKSRTLQIGTMRALGMSFKNIFSMIMCEECLLCVSSIVLGVGAGILSGVLFAPLLQSAFTQMGQMPPYRIMFQLTDLIKLAIIIIVLLAVSIVAASIMLKRIKAASAIKLGEE